MVFQEVWWSARRCSGLRRCGGLVVRVHAIARPGFDSRPGASPQCGLRGGRSHCYTIQINYKSPRPRRAVNKNNKKK